MISLILAAGDKFASFRKYTVPLATGCGGFALGRLSPFFDGGFTQIVTDGYSATFFILFFVILAMITIISLMFLKKGETWLAYCIFFFSLTTVPGAILSKYADFRDKVPPGDYLKLAEIKINAKEYDSAITYLELAKEKSKDKNFKTRIADQINYLISVQTTFEKK